MHFTRSLLALVAAPLLTAASSNPFNIPSGGLSATGGTALALSWNATTTGTVTLLLRSGTSDDLTTVATIAADIDNSGSYSWTPSEKLPSGDDYTIEIVDDADTSKTNFTPFFTLTTTTSSTSSSSSSTTSSSSSSSTSSSSTTKSATKTTTTSTDSSASLTTLTAAGSSSSSSAATSSGAAASSAAASSSAASSSSSASSTSSSSSNPAPRATAAAGMLGLVALGAMAL